MLLKLLAGKVVERFARMTQPGAQALALAVAEPDEESPPANPSHPACVDYAASDYCRESWQLHLAELKHRPATHWGTCQHGRLCAMVPVVYKARCLAVVKLAGPASLDKAGFKRQVELLELLVRDFVSAHAAFLSRVPGGVALRTSSQVSAAAASAPSAPGPGTHPQVARALEYIATHLTDPRLTVASAAAALGLCPTYLSELFVQHVGRRMSRFIADQRIDKAKGLLATTDWQIKRIAVETGHANPNWFCHVFRMHTGLTPGEYRAATRGRASGPQS